MPISPLTKQLQLTGVSLKSAKKGYFLKYFQILLQASSELKQALTLSLILTLQGSAGTVPMVQWQAPNVPIQASFNAN